MWTGFERRVMHDGTIQCPTTGTLQGRTVLVIVDYDDEKNPQCGTGKRPHVRKHAGRSCIICGLPTKLWPNGGVK